MMNNLPAELRNVISDLNKRLRKTYSAEGYSISELTTLSYLYRHAALFPTELAGMAKIKPQSMSAILKKLEEEKLIRRKTTSTDGRRAAISLTATGRKMVDRTRYERDEWLAAALQTLRVKEQQTLMAVIPILKKITEIP